MTLVAMAMPRHRRGQKMAFHFDEDETTLAWEAARRAGLRPGTALAASELFLPPWWWSGTGLARDDKADLQVKAIPTTLGPAVAVFSGAAPDVEAEAAKTHAASPSLPEAAWQKVRVAREGPDGEADHPLGAFVPAPRHDQILAERMRCGPGTVATWTTVSTGAAPSEFARLQDAAGAYHVVLVALPDGAFTVGIWTEAEAPKTGQAAHPVLRRLFRSQGAWRYGVKFGPAT